MSNAPVGLVELGDCPECRAAGSVLHGFCEVCCSDLGGPEDRPASVAPNAPVLHPSIPLRFADVVDELRTIASMAARTRVVEGASVAAACRRAESLLLVVRRQFLEDVVTATRPWTGSGPIVRPWSCWI